MRIIKIEQSLNTYRVTSTPYWFERLFGIKEKVKEYRPTGTYYPFCGQNGYYDSSGNKLDGSSWVGAEIDKWRRKQRFNL